MHAEIADRVAGYTNELLRPNKLHAQCIVTQSIVCLLMRASIAVANTL